MILIRFSGGLGNQLFQYAAASTLSKQRQVELGFDLTFYRESRNRRFVIDQLKIKGAEVSASQLSSDWKLPKIRSVASLFKKEVLSDRIRPEYRYTESSFRFEERFFKLGKDVYLEGYFQSPLYFSGEEDRLRTEFGCSKKYRPEVEELINRLRGSASVALHLRRGDYQNQPEIAAIHGVCSDEYYWEAIRSIQSNEPEAKFYIFSDDKNAAQSMAGEINGAIPVSGLSAWTELEEFHLLSACRHQIIANSTFSWWAAWMNDNPSKIVVAPKHWFRDPTKDCSTLFPADWRVI